MSFIAIISLLLGIAIAQARIQQATKKPPEIEAPKKPLSLEDLQGILVVYTSSEKPK